MSRNFKEEQITFLQRIKPIFSISFAPVLKDVDKEMGPDTQNMNIQKTGSDLNELMQRIEKIEKMLEIRQSEGVRKNKVKEQIISLLQQNKRLTATQLSRLIGLSRTRCSEYFRELMREGLAEGVIINRQKYYKLVGR